MNDRQLLYLLKIGECASISAAARELYVTPSTLVKSLQKVEAELGTPLFDRIGKFLYPTYAGTRYLQYARDMLHLQNQLMDEMSGIISLTNDLLRVGFQLNNDDGLLSVISQFHKEFPAIEIRISEGTGVRLQDLLDTSEIDFMIVSNMPTTGKWAYERIALCSNEVVIVTERDHPLVKKAVWRDSRKYPVVDAKLLEQESLVYHMTQQGAETILQTICEREGISLHTTMRATTISTILRLVSMGNGISLTFDSIAAQYVNSLNLSLLSFGEAPIENHLLIVYRKDRSMSAACRKLISRFQEKFQKENCRQ